MMRTTRIQAVKAMTRIASHSIIAIATVSGETARRTSMSAMGRVTALSTAIAQF